MQQELGNELQGDWILTHTGKLFYPMNPRPEDIEISDIAHALSNMCRWTGHCPEFYSVAQHSIIVSNVCEKELALWGLLHDSPEAYLCDLSRPVKHDPRLTEYRRIEDRLMISIANKYSLNGNKVPDRIKHWDVRVLQTEANLFFGDLARHWDLAVPINTIIKPVHPRVARAMFLKRFQELTQREETALVRT